MRSESSSARFAANTSSGFYESQIMRNEPGDCLHDGWPGTATTLTALLARDAYIHTARGIAVMPCRLRWPFFPSHHIGGLPDVDGWLTGPDTWRASLAAGPPQSSAAPSFPQTERCVASDLCEVPIGTQQQGSGIETRLGDHAVDRSAHRSTFRPQSTEQACRAHMASHIGTNDRQCGENALRLSEPRVGTKSLENLRDDYRKNGNVLLLLKRQFEAFYVRRLGSIEKICPGVGIDDNHFRTVRDDRETSMPPSQVSRPRRRRIDLYNCPFSTRRRSARSTTSRFVRAPVNRIAFSTSPSSISIFVRPMIRAPFLYTPI